MSKPLKINIPKPCSQEWDNMTPEGKGRHCTQCSKTIIDFSNYTDRELIEFVTKAKEQICGRFCNTQLNRVMVAYQPAHTPIFRRILFGTALAAWVVSTGHSQNVSNPVNTSQTPGDTSKKSKDEMQTLSHINSPLINPIKTTVFDTATTSMGVPCITHSYTLDTYPYTPDTIPLLKHNPDEHTIYREDLPH